MKKLYIILTISLVVAMLLSIFNKVNADENTNSFNLSSQSMLKSGDTIELFLNINTLNVDGGINALKGTLDYDTNIFDEIPDSETLSTDNDFDNYNLIGLNRWQVGIYNSTSKMFTLERNSKTTSTGEILKIHLKVKSNITASSTIIKVNDIQISGGEETGDINIGSVKCTINKNSQPVSESSEELIYSQDMGSTETQSSPQSSSQSSSQTSQSNTSTSSSTPVTKSATKSSVDNTTAKGSLPQTGVSNILIISIVFIIIISIIIYKKYKKI